MLIAGLFQRVGVFGVFRGAQRLPMVVLVMGQRCAAEIDLSGKIAADLEHRPAGIPQRPGGRKVDLLCRAHIRCGVERPFPLGKEGKIPVAEVHQQLLCLQRPLGTAVPLLRNRQRQSGQQERHTGQHHQRQPSPGGGVGPAAQVGEQHGAPAGGQQQERGPVRVQVGDESGQQKRHGEERHDPPPPRPHHRPADEQGQRGQRQRQKQRDRRLLGP